MSVGSIQPFRPSATVTLACSTTPSQVALAGSGEAVLVTNASSGLAFIRFGTDATVVATVSDVPIRAGTRALMHVGLSQSVSVLLTSGTGAVYVTRGDGTVY